MFERFRGAGMVLAGSLALLLAACGGGGGGDSNNGNPGGGSAKSCADAFSPEKPTAECQPVYESQCDTLGPRLPINSSEPKPCEKDGADGGVTAERRSADGVSYVLLKPASGGKSGLYVALHWRTGNGATMIDNMRLAELAKARDLTIAAPDSPYAVFGYEGFGVVHDWDYDGADEAIAGVIADAKGANALPSTVPVVLAGVSSGAAGVTRFYCGGGQFDGMILVASGAISGQVSSACLSATAASKDSTAKAAVGSVAAALIEGLDDAAYEDTVANYGHMKVINGCSGEESVALNENVDIDYSISCSSGDGAALVTVKDSGHNWPGMDRPIPSNPLTDAIGYGGSSATMSIFGPVSMSFDATLQGYDLVRWLD